LWKGKKEEEPNAKAQRRGEEDENEAVLACRTMGILPMILHGRDARATWGMAFAPAGRRLDGSPEGVWPSAEVPRNAG